jgi:tetratricopeptide (TPR) repeat protein
MGQNVLHNQTSKARRNNARIAQLLLLWLVLSSVVYLVSCRQKPAGAEADQLTRLTNLGKSQLDSGDPAKAVELFRQALALDPTLPEAQLNLANALLLANQPAAVIEQANQVLQANRESAAAYYLIGCADMRLGKAEEALKAFEQSHKLDPAVTALNFQLGLAHERLGHNDEALEQFQLVLQFEPEHPAASYRLSQLLLRLGRQAEADEALKRHQALLQKRPNASSDVAVFERCKHTAAKLPFKLEQPALDGIKVSFTDATASVLSNASAYTGPVAVLDLRHDGRNSLFVREGEGFRFLLNDGGKFLPQDTPKPALPGASYARALVGDLQNDQTEDVVLLSDKGCQVFKFTTNGAVTDISRSAGFAGVPVVDGVLVDFDYTGKLGFIALQPEGRGVRAFRNLSSTFAMYFSENNVTSGLPAALPGGQKLLLDDWNNDELLDVAVTRSNAPPQVFARERGGPFVLTNLPMPSGALLITGDLNNDALPDAVALGSGQLEVVFGGGKPAVHLPLAGFAVNNLWLLDYDNDGWLDIVVGGAGLRVWRNLGEAGFRDTTEVLGLRRLPPGQVQSLVAADFDGDCDTDLAVAIEGAGLKIWRNDGGNANHQLKLRLLGHRSNASALGVRYEVSAGGLRAWRTVKQLPIELGVAQHNPVDSVAVRWFDGFINHDDLKVVPCQLVTLEEIEKPTGSCPYLYSWNGEKFRFVTDLLGASPLGLRVTDTRFVDADPREYVHLGSDAEFRPRGADYVMQITEELREVLYLDEAKLVVVEHPAGTEVHTTGKLVPGRPFPPHELVTLHRRQPLRKALNHEGVDITSRLLESDGEMVSPTKLRARQLRGLAEPHSVTLDFGPLAVERPLVLALTGWLRFGGGMANVAAAHTPELPFPFPVLEVETAAGVWQAVEVTVGAPAGKTKTILVELAGKLPSGSRRLRLSAAFELHWDRIALFEKRDNSETRLTRLTPARADLHWRGYSEFEARPWTQPLTPEYAAVKQTADWTITPSGWCTRYGAVNELLATEDNALVLLNGGDELTLHFPAAALPTPGAGAQRDFFLYTVGWDKDADFHCELGHQVEPLPWHGMEDQHYGRQPRPAFTNDGWMVRFNTRWVGPRTLVKRR